MTDPQAIRAAALREALRIMDGSDRLSEARKSILALIDQAPEPVPQGVMIKPLEWFKVDNICTREKASAFMGHYCLVELDAGTDSAHFSVNLSFCRDMVFRFILEPDPEGFSGRVPKRFATPEEAKAAAQADYERRVLSALTTAPVSTAEAARVLLDAFDGGEADDYIDEAMEFGFKAGGSFAWQFGTTLRALSEPE